MNEFWKFELFDPGMFRIPERKISRVYMLCTCWDSIAFRGEALVGELNYWHVSEGSEGVNWHYVIDKDGNVCTGRPLDEPAIIAEAQINDEAIAIAVHGLWHFKKIQFETLSVLCRVIDSAYNLERSTVTFHGLDEVHDGPNPTFDYIGLLGIDAYGVLGDAPALNSEQVAELATCTNPLAVQHG